MRDALVEPTPRSRSSCPASQSSTNRGVGVEETGSSRKAGVSSLLQECSTAHAKSHWRQPMHRSGLMNTVFMASPGPPSGAPDLHPGSRSPSPFPIGPWVLARVGQRAREPRRGIGGSRDLRPYRDPARRDQTDRVTQATRSRERAKDGAREGSMESDMIPMLTVVVTDALSASTAFPPSAHGSPRYAPGPIGSHR